MSANTAGYDITSIQSFMGWQSNSAAHANQTYTVAVSYVGSPDFTDLATVSYQPFGTANSSDHESHVLINRSAGALAMGVDGIRFTFTSPAIGGTAPGTVVREIDVHGVPSSVVVTRQSSTGTPFASTPWASLLSDNDLINAGQATLSTATVSTAFFGQNTGTNNGSALAGETTTNTFFAAPGNFPATATYHLDVSVNTLGYDLSTIRSFMGWQANSGLHANQSYTVEVSTVGNSGYTTLAIVGYTPFAGVNSTDHESEVTITPSGSGVLAFGVDSIRFTFANPGTGGSSPGTVVREIDVHGVPSSVVVTGQSSTGTPFASTPWASLLSNNDLINAGQATLSSATVSAAFFGQNTGTNDGSALAGETTTNTYFAAPGNFPATATYNLDVSVNTLGYDLTTIRSFMGWQENSALHANQSFTVEVSTVGNSGYTTLAIVAYSPFAGADSTDHESEVTITPSGSGVLASGVDSIRFTFATPGTGGNAPGTVVRELDVHGVPTGGSVTPGTVTVASPKARQVIQRGSANTAPVAVSGTYTGTPDSIEARMVVMAGAGNSGTGTDWTTLVAAPAGGTYAGTLAGIAAGGWYQIEVRSVTGGTAGSATAIQRIGIGDIYITCGQSNSANYGAPAYTPTDDRVSARTAVSGSTWRHGYDPMPVATGSGGSPWSRLGDLLAAADHIPVGFLCVGVGATEVSQWVPGTSNYNNLLKPALQSFGTNGFRAVLWHQGESDALASTTPANYQTRMQSIVTQSRTDAGWTVPWYLAEVGFHPGSTLIQEEPVVAGQRRVIHADAQVFPGPVTDDFHLEGKLSDSVHFNAAGLADHAAQWAEVLGGTPPLAPKNGNFESNTALTDGGVATINTSATTSPSVIGWRALAASGEAVADSACGYYNPNDSFYPGAVDGGGSAGILPNMSGRHVAFLSGSSAGAHFLQTRRAMLEATRTYTLTVALGVRGNADTFGGAVLELLADGAVIGSRTITRADLDAANSGNAAGKFTDVALAASTGSVVTSGKALAVRIAKSGGAGTYLDFDNVRLVSALTPYAAWQIDHWGATTHPDAAWTANPDGDSFANGFEYYLGFDPKARNASSFLTAASHDGKSWMRYQIPLDPTVDSSGLAMWYSFDLGTWHPAATNPGGTVVANRTGNSWAVEISSTDHPRAFFRLDAGGQPQ